ncbi:MAG TPA: M23 family metallopeptidase [Solirubrobacteraceae bacterium]|nr:M23 family metallopeptidase [Solirubrobacteraceae bacterium]
MRGAAIILVAAGLLLGALLVSAAGAESPGRARALALIGGGHVGPQGDVAARGTAERRDARRVDVRGLRVERGESAARTAVEGRDAHARAYAVARSVDVLDGLVTAYGVRRVADDDGDGATVGGRVEGLRIDGETIGDVADARRFPLPDDAGVVIVNTGTIGLRVRLTKPLRGYAAGTDVRVAVARADATDGTQPAAPAPTPTATATPEAERKRPPRKPRVKKKGLERRRAPDVEKRLTAGGFAFPVYSDQASLADDYGGPRQIGPHEGNDIFAPFGSPVVAVADGVVSRVGTLEISGNRLWLTSTGGDAFFYAHLSAFSPAAVDGARVKAGTVLGFVGNTGDAEPTPPHLHFEVHPGGMEEDAVDPHPILLAWQSRRDVAPGAWLQRSGGDTAERPGSLVAVRDFIAE